MYLRAGVFSLGLLLVSRLLGLLRESAQAAAFGATGLGDAVIVMFTLPDLLVGILFSGALAYVLLPEWARQTPAQQDASQKKVAQALIGIGLGLAVLIWLLRDVLSHALAPGLRDDMALLGRDSLGWSAAVLPLAMLAALWVTRLQHERDFIGMYSANLVVNLLLVLALFLVPQNSANRAVFILGCFLMAAMVARLAWLAWRLPKAASGPVATGRVLPVAGIWIWAGLSSGLLLLLPLLGRSLASRAGEGALADFNYAWKLVELPLVLAIQLVASLAFPAITRTETGSAERDRALQIAFLLAWALACAAIAVVGSFSLPLAQLLFGWGRMDSEHLEVIARWGAIGIWSLLPQALIAVLLTAMAASDHMHRAVWAYAAGLAMLAGAAWAGLVGGAPVMGALNAILAGITLAMLFTEREQIHRALPWRAMLAPLGACLLLVGASRWFGHWGLLPSALVAGLFAVVVLGSALLASPLLRSFVVRQPLAVPQAGGQ
ncbi:lipid II flippase MurJ [Polaromonas aquatica]|uniref:lipid II flippase MurJ n=1 Tax=Polaromonas aquatica TaxID=332657 RepID=UPI003D6597E2